MKPESTRAAEEGERATLSVPEAAEFLGISTWLAWRLVWSGELPSIRLGNRVLVPRARLKALLAGDEEGSAA